MEKKFAEYLLKKTKDDYNLIAHDFSRHRAKPWSETKFLFDDYIVPGDRVLDLGCGCGQYTEFLKAKKVEYFGLDFSERLIEIAREKYPQLKFQIASALNLPFSENFFDKVYAIALFHSIPSAEFRNQVLKEIKRVLKKDGLLILTVWNLWQRWRKRKLIYKFAFLKIFGKTKLDFKDILMDYQGRKDCYFHCFTKNELRKVIEKAGFKIIKDGEFLVGSERKRLPNSNFYLIGEKTS